MITLPAILSLAQTGAIPPVVESYLFFVLAGIGVFLLCRRWHWSAVVAISLLFYVVRVHYGELDGTDFSGTPDYDQNYAFHTTIAMALAVILSLLGAVLGLKKKLSD
jgi:hypothetical protein